VLKEYKITSSNQTNIKVTATKNKKKKITKQENKQTCIQTITQTKQAKKCLPGSRRPGDVGLCSLSFNFDYFITGQGNDVSFK
jgi:hypothetical protein